MEFDAETDEKAHAEFARFKTKKEASADGPDYANFSLWRIDQREKRTPLT
jgi:hypothetical protein